MSLAMQNSCILFDLVFFLIENDIKKNPDDNVHRLYNWSPELSNWQNFRFSYYKLPYEMYFRFCVISTCILVCIFQSNWNPNLEQTIKQSPDIPWTFFEKKSHERCNAPSHNLKNVYYNIHYACKHWRTTESTFLSINKHYSKIFIIIWFKKEIEF